MKGYRLRSRRLVATACFFCAPAALAGDSAVLPPEPVILDVPVVVSGEAESLPLLRLDLPFGAVKPLAHSGPVKMGKTAAAKRAAAVSPSGGPLILGEGPLVLNLTGPAPKDLASGAVLNLKLPDGAVKAQAQASVGKEDGSAFWHKDTARLDADLKGPLGTALTLSGENRLSLTYRAPESVGASDRAAHVVRTESRSASASLALPLDPLRLTVGGNSSADLTQEGAPGSSFAQSAVRTADQTASVDVEWQPLAMVHLKGGVAAHAEGIRLPNAQAGSFSSLDPNLTATVKPLRDTTLTAKVEHSVAPYDAAAFAGYAKAAGVENPAGFQPDRAWQMETRLEQRFGGASLTATYTAARQGTVTEFADVGGVQAPATTPLIGRQSVGVEVSVPLARLGLPQTDVSSEARWRSSRVVDPVTGQTRTASGETGHQLSLRLQHKLPARHLSIGLNSEYTGARSSFLVSQKSTTEAGGSVGAFLSYNPGAYQIDVNLGGLYGGATRDTVYAGSRATADIARRAIKDNSGTTLQLSLKRAF